MDARIVVGSDIRRAGYDQIGPTVWLRRRQKVLRPDANSWAGDRETVPLVGVPHQGKLILKRLHHSARRFVRVELRFDGLGQPSGSRLQDVREPAEKKCLVRTFGRSLPPDRLVEPNQVFDVPLLEPVPHPVADPCIIFWGELCTAKIILDGIKVSHEKRVPIVAGFHLCDQRGHRVDIAAPEVPSVPFRFYRGSAAPTENVRDGSYVHALPFSVSQGLSGYESGKFRRITVNPVNWILSIFSEIPV